MHSRTTSRAGLTLLALTFTLAAACSSSSSDSTGPGVVATTFSGQVFSIGSPPISSFDNTVLQVAPGSQQNINWDETIVTNLTQTATASLPSDLFLNGTDNRQILVGLPSENVAVSADNFDTLPGGANNPSQVGADFARFTGTVNLAPINANTITVQFRRQDRTTAGLSFGFGCVFTDVERAGRSGLDFIDENGTVILTIDAQVTGSGESTFTGVIFNQPVVAQVRIRCGDNQTFGTSVENPLGGGDDHVVVDDFRFFLAQDTVPTTSFTGGVTALNDPVVVRFDTRRLGLSQESERSINWDGTAVTNLTTGGSASFPADLFLTGAGNRQIIIGGITDEASNFEQGVVSEDGFSTLAGGGSNPSANQTGSFPAFTGNVNFAVMGSDTATVQFRQSNQTTAGQVFGFGCVFTDVERSGKSGLRFYDAAGNLLLDVRAAAGANGNHQFVGALLPTKSVASVVIDMGDNRNFGTVAEDPAGGNDFVAVDDLLFFLADEAILPTTFQAAVNGNTDAVIERFDRRCRPLALTRERNINWDGGAVTTLTMGNTAAFPPSLFLTGAGNRQLVIGGAGEQPLVSEDAFATLDGGGNNPSAGGGFGNVSSPVNFTVKNGNQVTITFFQPDMTTAANIHGFGAIFTDVEKLNSSSIEFRNAGNQLIDEVFVDPSSSGASRFVGRIYNDAVVRSVVLNLGDNGSFGTSAESPAGGDDHVVLDDFFFFQAP